MQNNKFQIAGLGAALNVAKPKKGSTVAIFGLGAVGLAVCLKIHPCSFLSNCQVDSTT